jgi:hypothetical protein
MLRSCFHRWANAPPSRKQITQNIPNPKIGATERPAENRRSESLFNMDSLRLSYFISLRVSRKRVDVESGELYNISISARKRLRESRSDS